MSVNYSKIRLKIGVNEIEIYGTKEDMQFLGDLALRIYNELSNTPEAVAGVSEQQESESSVVTPEQLPNVQLDPNASLPVNILKLFTSEWGTKPRRLSEVKEVLDSFGLVYPKQTVAVSLLRLAKEGEIRRFKNERGEYVYVAVPSKLIKEPQGEQA
ncbi:MAG: hypothetical protein ACP5LW_00065 [Nitrososphaeria archaeon]